MTFYQKIETLCRNNGTNVTALAIELGFSSSAGTTWKKMKRKPRNSTLKKIADYFEITIDELEYDIDWPIDYDSVNTAEFNQSIWQSILQKNNYDERKSIDAYFALEKSTLREATSGNTVQNNHGIIGNTNAPVTIINGGERELSEQETALLDIFNSIDVVKQARLLVFASELKKEE